MKESTVCKCLANTYTQWSLTTELRVEQGLLWLNSKFLACRGRSQDDPWDKVGTVYCYVQCVSPNSGGEGGVLGGDSYVIL